jgi:hypothetical protein
VKKKRRKTLENIREKPELQVNYTSERGGTILGFIVDLRTDR